jgi:hypothetical protein
MTREGSLELQEEVGSNTESARYIYGIIEESERKPFDLRGIEDDTEVYTITHREIACAVSNSPLRDYSSMLREDLGRSLVKHQAIIERIMEDYTVIPMKFGTLSSNDDEVAQILERGYSQLKELLTNMDGKIELDVAATWDDLNNCIKEIGNEDKQIKELKAEISAKPPGETLPDKIKIGMMIKDALDKKREKEQAYIEDFLKEVAVDSQKHQVMDDTMILNCAFLLERTKEPDFDSSLKKLDEKYKQGVHFKCVGPLPPYSFATCQLRKLGYSEINEAAELLGLENGVSLEEIKESYRQFAQRNHPDTDPENSRLRDEFEKTTKAYKLLTICCQQDGMPFEDGKKEDFIMVEIMKP